MVKVRNAKFLSISGLGPYHIRGSGSITVKRAQARVAGGICRLRYYCRLDPWYTRVSEIGGYMQTGASREFPPRALQSRGIRILGIFLCLHQEVWRPPS